MDLGPERLLSSTQIKTEDSHCAKNEEEGETVSIKIEKVDDYEEETEDKVLIGEEDVKVEMKEDDLSWSEDTEVTSNELVMAWQETVSASGQGDLVESFDSKLTEAEHQSPWPFLGKWVQYKRMVGNTYIFQCLSCLPKMTELKVNKGTKANLKSHFRRMHPSKAKQFNEACTVNSRSWFGQPANSGLANLGLANSGLANSRLANSRLANSRLTNSGLANSGLTYSGLANSGLANSRLTNSGLANSGLTYSGLTNSGLANSGLANSRLARKKQRQMSVAETFGIIPEESTVLQSCVDKAIVRFVVDNMLPLQIVDSQSFRDMVHTLNFSKEVPSRRTLGRRILKTYEEMKESLTSKLEQVKWVGTTADCWSSNKEGCLGMTVHWLDPNTRGRKVAVLACEKIMGTPTYDVLAQAMVKIHTQFGIEDKVTMTTTDNVANFQKAFVESVSNLDNHQEEEACAPEPDGEPADAHLEQLIADLLEGQGNLELEFITFDDMVKGNEDSIIKLPRQHKCAAHTLNLVASADIEESHMPGAFKNAYRSAIAKAQALWNKQGTSTVFANSLYRAINMRLTAPTKTKWSSFYNSLVVLNKVLEEKRDQLHRCMKQQSSLTVFVQKDIDFMLEYAKVMAPVANALEHIQGEKQCYLGYLIPTLIVIKKKLVNLMTSSNLQFCKPLVKALLAAMERRFASTFEDEECLLATAFHPKFRLKWMGAFEYDERMVKKSEVMSLMEMKVEEYLQHTDLEIASSSSIEDMEVEDYYASICDEEDDTEGHQRSTKSKAAQIVKVWLEAKGTESLADPAFNNEKVLINLFLRYNTAMPCSAAVELLFSSGKDIMKSKRSSLSDKNFNMLMFMKGNMNMLIS